LSYSLFRFLIRYNSIPNIWLFTDYIRKVFVYILQICSIANIVLLTISIANCFI